MRSIEGDVSSSEKEISSTEQETSSTEQETSSTEQETRGFFLKQMSSRLSTQKCTCTLYGMPLKEKLLVPST
jgi:hypothetical protein